jgi:hypothetical protein
MEYEYDLLDKVFEHYYTEGLDLSDTKLYSCMHLLEPQYEMYKRFIKFGFLPDNITVLGKIYSSNIGVINELKELGITVVQPEFGDNSFDIEHVENCKNIIRQMEPSSRNIILDDGGELICQAISHRVSFAVEQTSSGYRKLENKALDFSVYNVARSKTKLTQESPLIARLVYERIAEYIEENEIKNPKMAVVGLGPIGESVYQLFRSNNFNIKGFDIETSKLALVSYLQEESPDIVIGATGSTLFSFEDLRVLESEHTYHFVSVSSSDREFPVAVCREGQGVHENVKYSNFTFVNNGFPITFKGMRNELTPIEIEKTIALLMGSVFEGVLTKPQQTGFIELPLVLEELINP